MIRSIGTGCIMSALTSSIAASWSGVSWNGKASSSSRCQTVSGPNAWPNWRNFSDRMIRPGELVIVDLAAESGALTAGRQDVGAVASFVGLCRADDGLRRI